MTRNMPEGWTPAYPATMAEFDDPTADVAVAYVGGQASTVAALAPFVAAMQAQFASAQAPDVVERARFTDEAGCVNEVFIAYWVGAARAASWSAAPAVAGWWADPARESGPFGVWREVFTLPLARLETLFSAHRAEGLGRAAARIGDPVRTHGYWGAMRDRVPAAAADMLAPGRPDPVAITPAGGDGRRVSLLAPGNLSLIRSGQDLTDCSVAERQAYDRRVWPALQAGLAYLRQHPVESGCLSCRFLQQLDVDGQPLDKTFCVALFQSLAALEDWSRQHPTHVAIFEAFGALVAERQGALDLRLWHEVMVPDAGGIRADYINCHPATGLRPHAEAWATAG